MSRVTSLARATTTISPLRALRDAVIAWSARRRERAMLARLDDHLLRDIGLTSDVVDEECRKPGWRA